MVMTNFPGGLSANGVPVHAGELTTGSVFYVHSGTGSNNNSGTETSSPMATIDAAVGLCTANNGDIIYVMPGHNESLTTATSLVVDVAGVQIIGIGRGNARPVLDFDAVGGSIEMDAADCRLSNMVLRVSVTVCTVAINVDAHRIELDNLHFTFEATGDDWLTLIDIDAFDEAYVHDCVAHMELGGVAGTVGIRLDDAQYVRIHNCRLVGNWTGAVIWCDGALSTGVEVRNCVLYNMDTTVYGGIDFGTLSTTGLVADCHITQLYAQAGALAKNARLGDANGHNLFITSAVSENAPGLTATIGITTST